MRPNLTLCWSSEVTAIAVGVNTTLNGTTTGTVIIVNMTTAFTSLKKLVRLAAEGVRTSIVTMGLHRGLRLSWYTQSSDPGKAE
jgi:hypothetical protein